MYLYRCIMVRCQYLRRPGGVLSRGPVLVLSWVGYDGLDVSMYLWFAFNTFVTPVVF
ncbi:hypothetical protein [Vibrio gallicus]|uniref:hypothetical protein n=1 Tax=Vibrio gallicus TaxID=190897 RepID=UPI0021C2740A|nr:hypothetical protein [Vibrio gallicus]